MGVWLSVCAGAAAAAPAKAGADFDGVWALDASLAPLPHPVRPGPSGLPRGWKAVAGWRTNGNTPPPLKPEAYAAIKADQAAELAGRPDPRAVDCKPAAAFDLMSSRPRMSVFQSPSEMVMIVEGERSLPRHIYIGHQQPPEDEILRSFEGHSVAHWEGAALVVDTRGVEPSAYFNSADFIPQSEKVHVVERLRLRGANTLIASLRVEDPQVLTRPWTVNLVYRKQPAGTQLKEMVCDREKNRAAANR